MLISSISPYNCNLLLFLLVLSLFFVCPPVSILHCNFQVSKLESRPEYNIVDDPFITITPPSPGEVVPIKMQSMSQIDLFEITSIRNNWNQITVCKQMFIVKYFYDFNSNLQMYWFSTFKNPINLDIIKLYARNDYRQIFKIPIEKIAMKHLKNCEDCNKIFRNESVLALR